MFRYFRLVIAVLSLVLVSSLMSPSLTLAATKELTESEAVALLRTYDIIRGDPSGDMGLTERLTRAEAAALFVRVQGKELGASTLAGNVPFTDAMGHWAAGEIAMADRLGLMHGDGSGTFRPDDEINYAEVLTILLRIVGREPPGPWSIESVSMQAAELGIAPAGVSVTQPAIRSKIFWSLATAVKSVPLPSGGTVLQKNFDKTPPELKPDRTTLSTSEQMATIAGSANGAVAVTVDGNPASLDSAGRFNYTAHLALGENTLKVEATDLAGNRSAVTVTAQRLSPIARIEVTGPAVIRAGTSAKLSVAAYDQQGKVVSLAGIKPEIFGDVATFSPQTTTLVAGNKAGQGLLTLTAGTVVKKFTFEVTTAPDRATALSIDVAGRAPSPGRDFTVTVSVVDTDGAVVNDDYGRSITLNATGVSGITIQDRTISTEAGVARFTVRGNTQGDLMLMATSPGLNTATDQVEIVSPLRVVLTATTSSLLPDGISSTLIRATLQDESGRAVNNTSGRDIQISLSGSGLTGQVTDGDITIRAGASNSYGYDGRFEAGIEAGTAYVTGTMLSSHTYAIQALSLPIRGGLSGARLKLTVPTTNQKPSDSLVAVNLTVLDAQGRLLKTGSYAYQITVATSNQETVTDGLPDGVEFSFSNSQYYPVDDGHSVSSVDNNTFSVIGRTNQGTATIYLRYGRSGVVTLTPKPVAGTENAYHPTIDFGPAASTLGMQADPVKVTFAGDAARIKLTVDSTLGKSQPGGALGTSGTNMTVRAQVVDRDGAVLPSYTGTIKLTRESTAGNVHVTRLTGTYPDSVSKPLSGNLAEWTVQSTGRPGYDRYTATINGLEPATVVLSVHDRVPDAPAIVAIRGSVDGEASPDVGYVAPEADYMDIQAAKQTPPNGEPAYWVTVKVYRQGESTPVYTGVVNLQEEPPLVRVPKANLRAGTATYELVINNGYGDSRRSPDPGYDINKAVNTVHDSTFKLTGGLFDRATGQLRLATNGLASSGSINTQKISIVKGPYRVNLSAVNAQVVSPITWSYVILQSSELNSALDPATFYGAVRIEAEDGWYTNADQSGIAQRNSDAPLDLMAWISSATLDEANRTLTLFGDGFTPGTVSLNQIHIDTVSLTEGYGSNNDSVTAVTETQISIRLSPDTLEKIRKLSVEKWSIKADQGWLKLTSGSTTYKAAEVSDRPIYTRVAVTSASYNPTGDLLTLRGVGFTGAKLDVSKLRFRATRTQTVYTLRNSATVTVVDGGTITIKLSGDDITYFELSSPGFAGNSVYLNTEEWWLTDSKDRPAATLLPDSVLFTVPAR